MQLNSTRCRCRRCPSCLEFTPSYNQWWSEYLGTSFLNPDLKHSPTEGPISNHSVTLIMPAFCLIGRHTACYVICLLTYLLHKLPAVPRPLATFIRANLRKTTVWRKVCIKLQVVFLSMQSSSSSSRMRVMNDNWSATKQRLHPQSVAEISRHSVLSGDRIRQCGTSSESRHKDTDQCL